MTDLKQNIDHLCAVNRNLEDARALTAQDVVRAATIAESAIRCLLGFDAWTLKEKIEARDEIKDILYQYGDDQ